MAITSVTRVWHGETWSDEKDGSREYEELYRVISNDPNEAAITVRSHASIPALWSTYGDDIAAVCTGRSARRIDASRLVWEVTARFEWRPEDSDDDEDPLDRDPKIRWTSQLFNKPIVKDRNGDALVNSAGEYFDPPVEVDFVRWTANIQFNATSIPTNIRSYAGAVSNGAITIDGESISTGKARVVGLDISEVQYWGEAQTPYRSITMAIECRDDEDDDFELSILDQGMHSKGADDSLQDIFIDPPDDAPAGAQPERTTVPVLLDGSGQPLATPSDPTTAVFLPFDNPAIREKDLTIFPGVS